MAVSDAAVRGREGLAQARCQTMLKKVLEELIDIRGDRSFRDTIETLALELQAKL
jgi:hypothetical protein